ncbi:SUMF1/EgtB/PvdO family nonheme iron enzyme [candidate division KSB1 bacterium]|nr:SUMF1/EgtB/PvdO family nonheme iron enzyme [candidate division KSB1 bacterium]
MQVRFLGLFSLMFFTIYSAALAQMMNTHQDTLPLKVLKIDRDHCLQFRQIPAGTFWMGSSKDEKNRDGDEGPLHKVTLSQPFYLCTHEMTQSLWTAIMGENPSTFRVLEGGGNYPVETVTWNECQEFISRLSSLVNGRFRLPTEAEWEYACRAGTQTPYYWDDSPGEWVINQYAWANSRSFAQPHPVGEKKPNAWGLYDMSGNVWEWCDDWFGPYLADPVTDPTGPDSGRLKIFRGGSWYDLPESHRSANRHKHQTDKGYPAIGLRLVWEPDASPRQDIKNEKSQTIILPGDVVMEFVYIPAGEFMMGSDETEKGRQKDEGPVHKVIIDHPFYLGKTEVTQRQWMAIMGENPSVFRYEPDFLDHPVDWVSWNDCRAYIKKMNDLKQGTFRFPTEAEWEYACRAGTTTRFYWGNDPEGWVMNRYAWAFSRAEGRSHPVGQKLPNAWGLYDMCGNVWEWCSDWRGDYESKVQIDPTGPDSGEHKIYRGGSWFNLSETLRSANRHGHAPDVPFTNAGLRLVLELN